MKKQTWLRLFAVLMAFGLIAAACGEYYDDRFCESTSYVRGTDAAGAVEYAV